MGEAVRSVWARASGTTSVRTRSSPIGVGFEYRASLQLRR